MAIIRPFRGVRYNLQRFQDIGALVSQPYDRIGEELKQQYDALSPYNIVRITLGHLEDVGLPPLSNGNGADVYSRARDTYRQWMADEILVREDRPVLYAYEQSFTVDQHTYARMGLIAAVELADFNEGIILPHERTHSGPKADRLRLLNALQVNPEQIFMLYPDPQNRVNALIRQAIAGCPPDVDTVELFEHDVRQRLWILRDAEVIAAIQREMAPLRDLIIADGHHRYETALTYRNAQRLAYPNAPATAAFNYIGATLVSMDDPGLVVLPTHREIRRFTAVSPAEILARAGQHFSILPVRDLPACLATINAHPKGHAFGFYGGLQVGFHVLTLRDERLIDGLIDGGHSHAWKSLAVSIVHKILLEQVAGVPVQGIEDKSLIRYHRNAAQAVKDVDSGEGNFVFFLSPTRIEDIRAVAAQGERMPQKSTDFYPKVISGLTMLPIGPDEVLEADDAPVAAETIRRCDGLLAV